MNASAPPSHAPRASVHHRGAGSGPRQPPGPPPAEAAPRAVVHYQSLSFDDWWTAVARTCDVMGCEVDAPRPLEVGQEVVVELEDERVGAPAFFPGTVRSCASAPPWRLSIRFDTVGMLTALRFF